MQICIRTTQKQKLKTTNTNVETTVQNLHATQTISRTQNQRVNNKMFSAT